MFPGKTFKAKKAYKLPLLVTLPFPRIWIKIKLNEVQLKPMGKLEWDFFRNGGSIFFTCIINMSKYRTFRPIILLLFSSYRPWGPSSRLRVCGTTTSGQPGLNFSIQCCSKKLDRFTNVILIFVKQSYFLEKSHRRNWFDSRLRFFRIISHRMKNGYIEGTEKDQVSIL